MPSGGHEALDDAKAVDKAAAAERDIEARHVGVEPELLVQDGARVRQAISIGILRDRRPGTPRPRVRLLRRASGPRRPSRKGRMSRLGLTSKPGSESQACRE